MTKNKNTDLQTRLCAYAMAHHRAKKAKKVFAKKFEAALQKQVDQYVELSGRYVGIDFRMEVSDKMQKGGELSEHRQYAFEECVDEWVELKNANKKLGAIRAGLLRTGQVLLNKLKSKEQNNG